MEELISILEEIQPDADYETCETLIDDNILDSFDMLSLISELNDAYDIKIRPGDMNLKNFDSAEKILALVTRLQDE